MDKQIEKFEFIVIDNNTGEEADIEEIAFTEGWAEGLIYCDMEGFAILEDGNLVLLDECGNCAHCPSGRFSIIPEGAVVLTKEEYINNLTEYHGVSEIKDLVRKETAEKFKKLLKALVAERNCNEDYDWEDVQVDGQIFIECVDEICKGIIGEENGN